MYTGTCCIVSQTDVHRDLFYCVTNCLMYTGTCSIVSQTDVHRDLLYCVTNCLVYTGPVVLCHKLSGVHRTCCIVSQTV